jgi:DNA-binding NarL/FixJ family response regulator
MSPTSPTPARIVLVEDHALVRSGIRALLESAPQIQVVGEASNGREAIAMAADLLPDLVLMDAAMPDLNGIEATRQILAEHPGIKIIILSMHADQQYVFEAMKAGAKGYVLKSSAFSELIAAIKDVARGRTYLSQQLTEAVVSDYARRASGGYRTSDLDKLTAREREVIQLVAEGRSSAEVAEMLHISVRTVETHRHNVMEKLNIRSIAALTKFAIRHGLCSLHDPT